MKQARVLTDAEMKRVLAVVAAGRHAARNRLALVLSHLAGLRVGDVVHGVGGTRIRNLHDFSKALSEPREGRVSLLVRRGKNDLQVPVDVRVLRPEGGMLKLPRPSTDTLLRT